MSAKEIVRGCLRWKKRMRLTPWRNRIPVRRRCTVCSTALTKARTLAYPVIAVQRQAPQRRLHVLTQAKRRARLTEAAASVVCKLPGELLVLHDSVAYGAATLSGECLASADPRSSAAAELAQLAAVV